MGGKAGNGSVGSERFCRHSSSRASARCSGPSGTRVKCLRPEQSALFKALPFPNWLELSEALLIS